MHNRCGMLVSGDHQRLLCLMLLLQWLAMVAASDPVDLLAKSQEFQRQRRAVFVDSLKNRRTASHLCDGCLSNSTGGTPVKFRVMFIEGKNVVENSAAEEAASAAGTNYPCGSCCFHASMAHPDCFVAENWNSGWIARPLLSVLQQTGAEIVAMTAANASQAAIDASGGQTNPYGYCPYEVLLGNVDLCVGDFWETIERRSFVAFTTPLDVNTFKLITTAEQKGVFTASRLLDIFAPFSAGVWACMTGMFAFAALCMWVVSGENEDFPPGEAFPAPKGLVKGFWVSSMGYLAGNQFAADGWAAKLIVLGFSFFLAITVASYTANLASFMVLAPPTSDPTTHSRCPTRLATLVLRPTAVGQVSSLEDVVKSGKTLCAVETMANMLTTAGIKDRIYAPPSEFMGSLFEALRNGLCDAALVGKMEYLLYVQAGSVQYDICTTEGDPNQGGGWFCANADSQLTRFDLTRCQCGTDEPLDVGAADCPADCVAPNSKFCDIIEVIDGTLDASYNFAQPVADWAEPYISAGIVEAKTTGKFARIVKEELWDQNPASCPVGSPQYSSIETSTSADALSLGVDSMAGTFVFSSIAMIIGLVVHVVEVLFARRSQSLEVTPEPPATGEALPAQIEVIGAAGTEGGKGDLDSRVGRIEEQLSAMRAQLSALLDALQKPPERPAWTGRGGSFRKEASFRKGGGGGHGR